jgi:hypothetical protein
VVEYPPVSQRVWTPLAATGVAHDAGARHPGFHKTNTIDYAIVLDGEIYAMMDVGETLLKPGDVLIQRGTNHAWRRRHNRRTLRGHRRNDRSGEKGRHDGCTVSGGSKWL